MVDIADQMTITDGLRAYMADHRFQRCATLQVQYLHVDVYRPDCSPAASVSPHAFHFGRHPRVPQ
jgi:hypothetical protein